MDSLTSRCEIVFFYVLRSFRFALFSLFSIFIFYSVSDFCVNISYFDLPLISKLSSSLITSNFYFSKYFPFLTRY